MRKCPFGKPGDRVDDVRKTALSCTCHDLMLDEFQGDIRYAFVNIEAMEGVFECKSTSVFLKLIEKVTDTMVSVEGEIMRPREGLEVVLTSS